MRKITHSQINDLISGFRGIYISDAVLAKQYSGKVRHLRGGKHKVEGVVTQVQALALDELGNLITIQNDGIWRQHDNH
ncbi:hypothetical protein [Serratia bockelmannii]|uniref:hypothetical protein n=1 Tax=Serratia bockelmannii TaxID=2703793 RepID=UPI002479A2C7|nr:hypothetical protein [Serratia bockelmannii]MDH7588536.1 hypothetical protein [Serratia bockelmannii]